MKILFLCGVFSKVNEPEVIRSATKMVEFSANEFQRKMISGFHDADYDFSVLSAPFIGSWPNASGTVFFRGFQAPQEEYHYVSFLNVWGLRQFSRTRQLMRGLEEFIRDDADEKLIVVYSPHTPFVEAAVRAKERDPRICICLVVPDLPQYMNLNKRKSLFYRVGKKADISAFRRLNQQVDSYVILTEAMKDELEIGRRPYFVTEGILSAADLEEEFASPEREHAKLRYVVYTGKLNEAFGLAELLDAFHALPDADLRLVLCGRGDMEERIRAMAEADPRILPQGQVPPDKAAAWVRDADVLVNPRRDDADYTKYSFPSKLTGYLLSGNPVVAYRLRGYPDAYSDFLYFIDDYPDLGSAILDAMSGGPKPGYRAYAAEHLLAERIAHQIVRMNRKQSKES